MQLSHKLRQRELSYLQEDLTKAILKIQLSADLQYYDLELAKQVQEKLVVLGIIQIGAIELLDSIQYLLGEIRTGIDEHESLYWQLTGLIDLIQDYLDWVRVSGLG